MSARRRGVSLTEMLVVMISCTAFFSLSGELLCRVMRIQSVARDRADVERSALRLSHQFRSDVHLAHEAVLDPKELGDSVFLRLSLASGSRLDYSHRDNAIVRERIHDEKVTAREEFEFPRSVDVAVKELAVIARVALTVVTSKHAALTNHGKQIAPVVESPVSLELVAVLGRNHRSLAAIDEETNE